MYAQKQLLLLKLFPNKVVYSIQRETKMLKVLEVL